MYRFRGLAAATPDPTVSAALQSASQQTGVPLALLQQVAKTESGFNPAAVSSAGAQGLMQLMPATATSLGVSNPFDPTQNALGGAQYLEQLYGQYGDWNTALIAYNEGPGNLASKGVFPSSASYAQTILSAAGPLDEGSFPSVSLGPDDNSGGVAPDAFLPAASPVNWTIIGAGVAAALVLAWTLN